ncbi:hypothetical protein [Stenotrophomonas panacihumi]|nr:hypothetical protein [Stenotrophomonas panacihumi]
MVSLTEFFSYFDAGVYERSSDIPKSLLEILLDNKEDTLGLLDRGRDWAMEPLALLQPHSYEALLDCESPLLLGMSYVPQHFPDDQPAGLETLAFDSNGRMVEVRPCFRGDSYERGNDCFGTLLALPDGLAKSWLWRTEGWRIPGEPYGGLFVNRRLVTHPSFGWLHADRFLDSLGKGWRRKFLPKLVEMFPDCLVPAKSEYDKNHYMFRCFLDTRPANVFAPTGDQFFVISTRRDQVVYHVHEGDFANLRVLHDPVDAIDRYSAHTLRNLPGEFDFSSWSEPYRG